MAKRSLKASEAGIKKAKQAFRRTGWTQEYLASAVGLETRQSIWKFFSGRPIERHLFLEICFELNLDWEEIVAPPEDEEPVEPLPLDTPSNGDQVFQSARSKIKQKIQAQCGLLQVSLDTAHPLAVEQVYTSVPILPTPNSQRWLEVSHLQAEQWGNCDSLGQRESSLTIPEVLAARRNLMILGRPGAGKTTLLQYLATQCANGNLYPDAIPVFLSLRSLAIDAKAKGSFSLEGQIAALWSESGFTAQEIQALLQDGKLFILLDGLDEVSRQDSHELSHQIQKFTETHPQAVLVMTCRLAAQDYQFRGFTYVELADFDFNQIAIVARKWFVAMCREQNAETVGLAKAEQFLQHLARPENAPIREMVTTPLLLHLACLVFHERAMFPSRRAKLYQAGLDILLVRWDAVRGIHRDLGAGQLPLPEVLNLLSQIAATLFEQGNIYFEKSEILPIISDFLLTLPNPPADSETLWLNSEAVLRAIVLQSGLLVERARDIYSFSHLTFQEYLTARKCVARCLKDPIAPLQQLARRATEQRWSEVILLTLSLLPKADRLLELIQQEVNALAQASPTLQQVLLWVSQKAKAAPTTYNLAAIKAFYLPLCDNQDLSLAMALDGQFAFDLEPTLAIDLAIARTAQKVQQMGERPTYEQILDLWFALDFGRQFPQQEDLNRALVQLKASFPSLKTSELEWLSWWSHHRASWLRQFQEQILKPRNMDIGWDWNLLQQQTLREYYKANQFLVDCLRSECCVDRDVLARIEATLLSHPLAGRPDLWAASAPMNSSFSPR